MFEKKEHQNSGTLGKDTINNWIIPFLSVGKRGFKSNFDLASIFLLILKRLKTGVQWRELPIESYFEKGESTGYQARKKSVTTNSIFLCDNKGQMIAMGSPKAGIEHKGLFLNADAGFDSKSLRDFLESKEIIANIKKNIFFIIVVFI